MSTDPLRQEIAATADLVVVKVGTRVLTNAEGQLNLARIDRLAEELTHLRRQGKKGRPRQLRRGRRRHVATRHERASH